LRNIAQHYSIMALLSRDIPLRVVGRPSTISPAWPCRHLGSVGRRTDRHPHRFHASSPSSNHAEARNTYKRL